MEYRKIPLSIASGGGSWVDAFSSGRQLDE
jgi:hypothetical protein